MKTELKEKIFEKRNVLSKEAVKEKSSRIRESVCLLKEFKNSKNILFYVSFNNEVDTHEIIKELLKNNQKRIIIPFVQKNKIILQLSELEDFNDLEPKTFGILEPKDDKIKKFDPGNVELVIVPGIAFDRRGHRIGYGLGHYDRFLAGLKKKTKKIALAFDFQIIDKIPEEEHDIAMDIIVTNKEVIRCK